MSLVPVFLTKDTLPPIVSLIAHRNALTADELWFARYGSQGSLKVVWKRTSGLLFWYLSKKASILVAASAALRLGGMRMSISKVAWEGMVLPGFPATALVTHPVKTLNFDGDSFSRSEFRKVFQNLKASSKLLFDNQGDAEWPPFVEHVTLM